MRYELTDFEWAAIRSFLPNKPRGVPRVNDRRVLNGIFWVLRSGAPWRYQIKCRKLETPAGSRQPGFIRRLPDRPFDQLAAVLLDGKFRVLRGALIPYEIVEPRATYVDSVKAWRFILRDSVWDIEGVVDVTDKLKAAALLI